MFGFLLHPQNIPAFPIFVIGGLVVWTFFQQSLLSAADSLIDQGALIRKARFPRETIPASVVSVQLITLCALLVVVVPLSLAIRGTFGPRLLLLPLVVALLFCFVLGCALIVAVLHAYFRDVAPILTAALLPWFFVSGILFRLQSLPGLSSHPWIEPVLRWVNPVAPFVEAVRTVLYDGHAPSLAVLLYTLAAAAVALALGTSVFRSLERELAVVL
jgi:ABC-type polysaccharide/polyol phosphate export permease